MAVLNAGAAVGDRRKSSSALKSAAAVMEGIHHRRRLHPLPRTGSPCGRPPFIPTTPIAIASRPSCPR